MNEEGQEVKPESLSQAARRSCQRDRMSSVRPSSAGWLAITWASCGQPLWVAATKRPNGSRIVTGLPGAVE